jgi:hypothetical protein
VACTARRCRDYDHLARLQLRSRLQRHCCRHARQREGDRLRRGRLRLLLLLLLLAVLLLLLLLVEGRDHVGLADAVLCKRCRAVARHGLPQAQALDVSTQRRNHASALCSQCILWLGLVASERVLAARAERLAAAVDACILQAHQDLCGSVHT